MPTFKTIRLYSKTGTARTPIKLPTRTLRQDPLFRELLETLYDAVLITDLDGGIIDANPRAEEFLHYRKAELCRLRVADVVSGVNDVLLGTIKENIFKRRFTLLEAYCIRKDRSTFPVEISVNLIHISEAGELCFFVRNVSRKKKAEGRMRAQSRALQNSASGIAMCGLDAKVDFVNVSFLRLWGYDNQGEVIGMDVRKFFAEPEGLGEVIGTVRAGESWTGELAGLRPDGKKFYVQVTVAPNRDAIEKVNGLVFSFVDVSERKETEESLRKEAQQLLGRAQDQRDFSGLLNIISISDVIQLINATGKSGTLEILKFPFRQIATLVFEKGEIIDASCNNKVGEEAVYATMRCKGEEFNFVQGKVPAPTHPISKNTMGMLMEGARQIDEAIAEEPAGDEKSILVVDDEPSILMLVQRILEGKGYRVYVAPSAQEAFKILMKQQIDLVMLDVLMPQKDGFEAYTEIKEYQDVPVLFATGNPSGVTGEDEGKVDLLQQEFITGKTDIVYKPFDTDTLCEKIENLLGDTAEE